MKATAFKRSLVIGLTAILMAFIPEVGWIAGSLPKVAGMDNVRIFTGADTAYTCGFDGSGIVGGVKDDGIDRNHPDYNIFEIFGNPPDAAHGTCAFGVIFSTGANNEQAKGMLPNANGVFHSWCLGRMTSMFDLQELGGVFQSNSWSQGEYNGVYSSYSREDDQSVVITDITMLWPTGDKGAYGAQSCYSDAVAKNVISVGALLHQDNADREDDEWGACGSVPLASYGPAADGRIKPDLCGPDEHIYTTDGLDDDGNDGYRYPGDYVMRTTDCLFGRAGAAAAVVAGAVGIVYQMYRENLFGNNLTADTPHASTVKALLIVDAYQYEFWQATRYQQGWGLPDLRKTLEIAEGHFIVDEDTPLQTGDSIQYSFTPQEGSPLKISLVWTDPPAMPGANPALVNDLNLKVTGPDANTYRGNCGLDTLHWSTSGGVPDNLNNVENVFIENPEPGQWTIEVIAENIAMDGHTETPEIDQDFALVATTGTPYIRGDCNGDGAIDVADVMQLINYLFIDGSPPDPLWVGDCNCDEVVDTADVIYLINYLFLEGSPPGC